MTSYTKGVFAENLAKQYLMQKGFIFLKLRYKTPHGEIDLVMQDQDTIVAVEVKYRKKLEDSHYAISERQKKRIENALLYYLQEHNQDSAFLRFDVVLLSLQNEIQHYVNAW